MNRLQKKCLIATAGTHLLVVVLLFCSGFVTSKPKLDDTQLLDVIPANVIDAAFNSGVKNAPKPPPPAEPVKLPEPKPEKEPTPEPPKPKPEPEKVKEPEPVKPEKNSDFKEPEVKPKPPKPDHKIDVDISKRITVKATVKKPTPKDTSAEDEAREEAKRQERIKAARLKAIAKAAHSISENFSSATTVDIKGTSSVSYASYASVVKSIYEAAWRLPENAANDEAVVKVSVTIGRDGHVIESHVVSPSGDSAVDQSVRRTLDRVDFVREFPEGATESQKTFVINFSLKAKRMNG